MEFQNLILDTIKRRMSFEESRSAYSMLLASDMRKADLIRKLQIIRDSIDISLSSKKRDVAESRNKTLLELFTEIKQKYMDLMKPDVFVEVSTIIENAGREFPTALYKNIASGYIEKATKLKTEKAKLEHWNKAREILNEGIKDPKSDRNALENMLSQIPTN